MQDNEMIIPLKGADRVRKRPAVIFGSATQQGVETMASIVLAVFAREALEGNCPKIELQVSEDGSVSVKSHDRGLWLGPTCPPEQADWYPIFCQLHIRGYDEPDTVREDWYVPPQMRSATDAMPMAAEAEFALCVAQYASESMQVEVVRDGERKELFFERGNYVSGPQVKPCNADTYTRITYRPDPTVFDDIKVAESNYMGLMRQLAVSIPGLVCVFEGRELGRVEFCYPNGLADYVAQLAGERALSPILVGECGNETASARVALCVVSEGGSVQCSHNLGGILGGTHTELAWEMILRHVSACVDADISQQELAPHIILAVDSRSCTCGWLNGCRTHIDDGDVAACVRNLFDAAFWRDSQKAVKEVGEKILSCRR